MPSINPPIKSEKIEPLFRKKFIILPFNASNIEKMLLFKAGDTIEFKNSKIYVNNIRQHISKIGEGDTVNLQREIRLANFKIIEDFDHLIVSDYSERITTSAVEPDVYNNALHQSLENDIIHSLEKSKFNDSTTTNIKQSIEFYFDQNVKYKTLFGTESIERFYAHLISFSTKEDVYNSFKIKSNKNGLITEIESYK